MEPPAARRGIVCAASCLLLGLALLAGLAACNDPGSGVGATDPTSPTGTNTPSESLTTAAGPTTTTTTLSTTTPSITEWPEFTSSVTSVDAERLGVTWRPECPVTPDDLRLVTLMYAMFDGTPATGELVVNVSVVEDVIAAFTELYEARFPIGKMITMEAYGGDDLRAAMEDNTSGFNCRTVLGEDRWSQHSYGLAVDINPLENPYLVAGEIRPPAGEAYLDRADVRPGMIIEGDLVFRAFTSRGFEWGGYFVTTPDYQHFALPR